MFDAFTRVVWQADARGEYLNSNQLEALTNMVKESNKRRDLVTFISSNATTIITHAARSLFTEQPQLIAPGGNAYTSRRMAACLRDLEIFLRYVTYALFTGDASVLEERCLNGIRETYVALGVPGASVAVAIQKIKEITLELFTETMNPEEAKKEPVVLKISEIRQFYPKQWITLEVTKFEKGFPSEGKVKFYDSNISNLTDKIEQKSENLYTFFTGRIDETPEVLLKKARQKENSTFTLEYSSILAEVSLYFDMVAASVA